jgi:hypothetical protein
LFCEEVIWDEVMELFIAGVGVDAAGVLERDIVSSFVGGKVGRAGYRWCFGRFGWMQEFWYSEKYREGKKIRDQ